MPYWEREPFRRIIDEGHFAFDDAGPLISPIKTFKLYRTDKLQLTLETFCGKEALAQETLRHINPASFFDKQEVVLKSMIVGTPVVLKGVTPESHHTSQDYAADIYEIRESAIVYAVECDLKSKDAEAFTIDWIENVRYWLAPASIRTMRSKSLPLRTTTRSGFCNRISIGRGSRAAAPRSNPISGTRPTRSMTASPGLRSQPSITSKRLRRQPSSFAHCGRNYVPNTECLCANYIARLNFREAVR